MLRITNPFSLYTGEGEGGKGGRNHHFHRNNIGVIWACTAHWCWYGPFRLWPTAGVQSLNVMPIPMAATARYSLPACSHTGGDSSARDSGHSFGHTELNSVRVVVGGKEEHPWRAVALNQCM